MKIVAIRDIVAPIKSNIANAYIDFSTMTASAVAVVTDRVVDGHRVVGFGFNSNGRYAPQGLLRERFIPRLLAAAPEDYQGDDGFIDPH
ncbi:MAG TPA: mandelate racemase, partial [Beijerinckiaceae bacterium]|nr:mandelate racemase [Beijerinckiaceae bacterium]